MKAPCFNCDKKGCGKQSSCPEYMEYFQKRREMDKARRQQTMLNMYTRDAIKKCKSGTGSTMARYRQGGIHEDKS